MTKPANRATRVHARRTGALARLSQPYDGDRGRRLDSAERRSATDAETLALLERTAAAPQIKHTQKKVLTQFKTRHPTCSDARWERHGKSKKLDYRGRA